MTIPAVFKFTNWITGTPVPIDDAMASALTAPIGTSLAAALAAAVPASLAPPGGRLTLTTGTPILSSTVLAATTIFYTSYLGATAPFYNGTTWNVPTLSELSLALDSDNTHTGYQQSGFNFDLYLDYNSGAPRLVTGPAWSTDILPSIARTRVNGILLNAAIMTVRFGTGATDTVSIAAQRATYVGTFRASANGQTEFVFGAAGVGGSSARIFLYNAYNRVLVPTFIQDSTASWTEVSNSGLGVHPLNGSLTNRVSFVDGLGDSVYLFGMDVGVQAPAALAGQNAYVSMGLDSISTAATPTWFAGHGIVSALLACSLFYIGRPGIGFHFMQELQVVVGGGAVTFTFYGGLNNVFTGMAPC